jgi:hypothetical protein
MIRYYLGRKNGEVKVYRFNSNASEIVESSKINTDNIERSYFVFPDRADCIDDSNCTVHLAHKRDETNCDEGYQLDESLKCKPCPGQEVAMSFSASIYYNSVYPVGVICTCISTSLFYSSTSFLEQKDGT